MLAHRVTQEVGHLVRVEARVLGLGLGLGARKRVRVRVRARVEVDGRQQGGHRQREAVGLREGDGPEGLLGHEDGGLPLARVRGRSRD